MSGADETAWDEAARQHDDALYRVTLDPIAAEPIARAAMARLAALLGSDHPDSINARATLGLVMLRQGRIGEAIAALQDVVATLEVWLDEPAVIPLRVRARLLLGDALRQAGQYAYAAELLLEAAFEAEGSLADDDGLLPELWNALGLARGFAGDYVGAADAYAQSAAWFYRHDAGDNPERAALHHNVSRLAYAQGDYARALEEARSAVDMRERLPGDEVDAALGQYLAAVGAALEGLGRLEEAHATYGLALQIFGRTLPAEHPEVANLLHHQAHALAAAGYTTDAIARYRESLALKERILGPGHAEVAATLGSLAATLAEAGKRGEAATSIERARAIAAATLPEGHPWRTGLDALAESLLSGDFRRA